MFDWLHGEIERVNTRKFFVVDGPASSDLREAIERSGMPIPPSYREFVFQFGNAKFYREGGIYLVQVFASLERIEGGDGAIWWQFGRTDMAPAYFKDALLVDGEESPVFEWQNELGVRHVADTFEGWLKRRCAGARALFKKKQWEAIVKGPPPFSMEEQAIIEARRRFRWRTIGVSPAGNLLFEVHNGSNAILPYLSIGIRGKLRPPKSGPLNGGIWLPVASVRPGETRVIEKDCYKDVVDPIDIEAFPTPDPEPEDRDRYWEFGR